MLRALKPPYTIAITLMYISTDVCDQVFDSAFQTHSHLRYGERKYGEILCVLTHEHKNTVKETLTFFQTNVQLTRLGQVRTKQSSTRYAL
jgi:hypothetical protein